jgi:glycosyltransferase involved in cell wall biosynthesis
MKSERAMMTAAHKILQLVPSFGGGGAETQLAYLSAGLVRRGWHVDVLNMTAGPNLERFRSSGAVIHTISTHGNYDPMIPWKLRQAMRRLAPDLVQTWIPMMDVLGGFSARLCGIPWVISERSSPLMFPSSFKLQIRAHLARCAAAVISNSTGGDAYWATVLPDRILRAVVGNGLPLEEIDAVKPASAIGFGLDDSRPLILHLGRINAGKNVIPLVDALARVVAETDAVALLCGIGTELEGVRQRIARLGIADRIVAPGYTTQSIALMKRASLFVSLSRYEGMPNAVMEAAAAGCPQVLSDIPAHREILDDSTAVFVDVNSPSAAADAMIGVLRNPELAARRAADARARSRAWSIAQLALEYEKIYEQILERARRLR